MCFGTSAYSSFKLYSMAEKVAIIDYGSGNHFSVQKKLSLLGFDAVATADAAIIADASKIILPGVGHFGNAMKNLQDLQLVDILNEEVITKKKPILGICLGMQLMAKSSDEGSATGLGWIDAKVVHFKIENQLKFKVPHTGWNQMKAEKKSAILNDLPENPEFYFVHAFHFQCNDEADILGTTNYESRFVSAIEKGNIYGMQFHPEKSHDVGLQLIKNFVEL